MAMLELDTASLTGPERFGVWAETIATAFGPFGIPRNDPERFHGRLRPRMWLRTVAPATAASGNSLSIRR